MRRVRTIHTLRAVTGTLAASFVLLAVSLYLIGREVWVARVFENMPRLEDAAAVARFFTAAFLTTEFAVQALVILSLIAGVWLLRGIGKLLAQPARYA
jgi:hypothetical protein